MIDLMDLVRGIAAEAARAEENTNYPLPCTPGSPLLASVRQACVERGYTFDGLAAPAAAPQGAVAERAAYGHAVSTPRPSAVLIAAVDEFRKAIHDFLFCTGDGYEAMLEAQRRIFAAAAPTAPAAHRPAEQDDTLNSALQRAASELPDGYTITVEVELGYGGVSWCSPDGEQCDEYHSDILAEDVIDALADAKQAAAIAAGASPSIESEAA